MPEYLLILIRSVLAFIFLLFLTRLMGKKQISQLTFFDYVVGITIGSIASTSSIELDVKTLNGLISMVIWGFFPILLSIFSKKSFILRHLFKGRPTVLIQNGKVLEQNLKKSQMTIDNLMLILRQQNAFHLADVEFAILETNGQLSVMKKSESQPLTPKTLGLASEEEHDPRIVVIDGHVMEKTLSDLGYSKEWLLGELIKQGAIDFSSVFLAQVDSKGNVYADLYHDKLKEPQVKQKPLLAATLKKVQADLESFSLQSKNEQAKQIYKQQAKALQQLIDKVQPYLKG